METENEVRPVVGLLINQIEGRYQSLIRRGLADFAREKGVTLRTFVGRSLGSPYGNEDLFNAIYRLARGSAREAAPDGLIVTAGSIGSFLTPEDNGEFLAGFRPIPLVTIGMSVPGYDSVTTDYAWGLSALVDHLVTVHGFRRFAFFKGPEHSPDAIERLASWKEALARHGIGNEAISSYQGDFTYGSGQELAARLDLSRGVPFDVISCANDDMALGFLQAMRKRGFSCPRDYAITGFDDIPDAGFLTPLLTTVHQPLYEQAYAAGTRLLSLMGRADNLARNPEPLVCAPIIRESCGCAEIPLITARRSSRDSTREAGRDAQTPASLGGTVRGGLRVSINALLAGETALPGPVQEQAGEAVASLCDSATIDLRKFTDRPLFLQTLSGWLDMTLEWDDFSNRWHVLLSLLHRELLRGLVDARARGYMEDLIASGFALLTRKSSERQARELSTLRNTMQLFRDLSQRLGTVVDEAGLRDQLRQVTPLMGFSRVVVALHGSGPKPFNRAGSGDFYRDAAERVCVDRGGDVRAEGVGSDSIYLPLLGRDHSYGYIILEGTGLDPLIFESMREQVSLSLESLALRESDDRYREIAAAVPVIVLETDVMLRITYGNQSATAALALDGGNSFATLKGYLEPEDREIAEDIVRRIASVRELDYPAIRLVSRGRRRYVPIVRVTGKFDQNGNLVSLRWNALDPLPFLKVGMLPDRAFFEEHGISAREREVIELQLQGCPIKEIANRLYIADSTVKGHLTQVYTKLGISGKGELLRLLRDAQVGRMGFSAYAFSLLNQLLTIDEA